ncbi:carbamoyltransferase HypF [Pseudanabaena sp. PCC 6802]|uniref:carbamoyltransferase HypF n=1 Tax=Pseudanabaena sp. PCC 6802 TaxID=118173 RepID=UPI000347A3AA|nr:carbamoyltransferase HypF [Pseudanabaena sp. PCC 6802]
MHIIREATIAPDTSKQRLSLNVRGAVQGVGFRPFVYRLALELNLTGWVNNSLRGVSIEVEGTRQQLQVFWERLELEKPPRSQIHIIESTWLAPVGYTEFSIRTSDTEPNEEGSRLKSAIVLPDLATCPECRREIFDCSDRRYRYPFTNCTNCGPRYSIIEALPYDRSGTTMKDFQMCPQCQAEYSDPRSRRFHAQPNACPHCGPQLELWDRDGRVLERGDRALLETAAQIERGKILAVKGLGGFHLIVDARNPEAVGQLRSRKHRPHKPFALMYPSLEQIRADCIISELEANLLRSPEAPIVLLRKRKARKFSCDFIAPANPYLGVMLPYTPLHHLLMASLQFPIVATSGNLADEPICINESEAIERLGNIADLFLVHNRPIVRPVDDSIVRVMGDRPVILRRARGYAPLPINSPVPSSNSPAKILALGSHLKNTIALGFDGQIFLSQHVGDLETVPAFEHFQRVISSLSSIYEFQPEAIACDAHPDYLSSQFAQKLGQQLSIPVIPVQHHYAHALSCTIDNQIAPPVLGVVWDGTGYGLDGTIWGGEFFRIKQTDWERVAHFRTFLLPGGDKAVKQPRRAALGLLWEMFGADMQSMSHLKPLLAFSTQELTAISTMLCKRLNAPLCSSVGRLFDAIASLLGACQQASFEGQAAMALEFMLDDPEVEEHYEFELQEKIIDWSPAIAAILHDLEQEIPPHRISAKFHNTLVEIIVAVAKRSGESQVVLTGGCFQNKYLTERTIQRLKAEGFSPYWHQHIPPNDGAIAVGQVMAVARQQNLGFQFG